VRRREFLAIPAGALGGALLYVLARESARLKSRDGSVAVPLRFFTADEARVVAAACERIFPHDANGPGATDAGVVIYIDRQLAGPYGRDKYRYVKGPFVTSVPGHGYQGKETPRQIYREGIRALGRFADLSVDVQDRTLVQIEHSTFFGLLRRHTIEGMFCDPMHGGNTDLAGWKLIGYPGPQMNYRDDVDRHFGQAWRPKAVSLQQVTGRTLPLLEDEKE
jgi:gluconate 2-dehydrogenase gamma chain